MTVLPGNSEVRVAEVIEIVNRMGMRAEPIRDEMARDQNGESWWSRHGRLGLTIASAGLTASAFLIHLGLANSTAEVFGSEGMGNAHAVPLPVRILYLLAVLSSVYHVIPKYAPHSTALIRRTSIGIRNSGKRWFASFAPE